jgi:hypothetical protein
MSQPTCEERVNAELESTLEDLRKLWDAYCDGLEDVEDLGNIYDYGLAFDYVPAGTFKDQEQGYFRYQLSWGGPSDEFRFFTDYECNPSHVEYWFLDWFDGAHKVLRGDDERLLLEIFSWFDDMGSVEREFEEATDNE